MSNFQEDGEDEALKQAQELYRQSKEPQTKKVRNEIESKPQKAPAREPTPPPPKESSVLSVSSSDTVFALDRAFKKKVKSPDDRGRGKDWDEELVRVDLPNNQHIFLKRNEFLAYNLALKKQVDPCNLSSRSGRATSRPQSEDGTGDGHRDAQR